MKKIRVINKTVDVVVVINHNYVVNKDVWEIGVSRGEDFKNFYHRNKSKYDFVPMNYYDKPYTQEDILNNFLERKPILQRYIDEFDLELT